MSSFEQVAQKTCQPTLPTSGRIQIPVNVIEFDVHGNTLWVQGANGTVLRIKVEEGFTIEKCETSPVSHSDIYIPRGKVGFCLGPDAFY